MRAVKAFCIIDLIQVSVDASFIVINNSNNCVIILIMNYYKLQLEKIILQLKYYNYSNDVGSLKPVQANNILAVHIVGQVEYDI